MKKMPTKTAEKVYEVLCKFANANPSYPERETFVFHFGVLSTTSPEYKLNCVDDAKRVFRCYLDGKMWVEGTGTGKVNSILRKISDELISFRAQAQ